MSKTEHRLLSKISERRIAVSVLVHNIKLSYSVLIVYLLQTITENLIIIKNCA